MINHRYSRNVSVPQDGYIYLIFNTVANAAHYTHLQNEVLVYCTLSTELESRSTYGMFQMKSNICTLNTFKLHRDV